MALKQQVKKTIKPKKSLGQNFLRDKNILKKISLIKNLKDKEVVEIGLGQGDLTHFLKKEAKEVLCYEIDKILIENFGKDFLSKNVKIIHQDFLKASFNWKEQRILVANIPYYITSDILFKIFNNYGKFASCVIMMQEEVANRLVAKVNSKEYGKLTLTTSFFVKNIKKHFKLNPSAFFPPPKVNSAVISFDLKTDLKNVEQTKNFIKKIFTFRRKTILNNLKQFNLTNKQIEKCIENINKKIKNQKLDLKFLNTKLRPQNLSLEHIGFLIEEIKQNN